MVAQLEGDLLVAFKDDKAAAAYLRAVELYARICAIRVSISTGSPYGASVPTDHQTCLCKLVFLAAVPSVAPYKARALEQLMFLLLTERAWR